jgi:hypothetical protein
LENNLVIEKGRDIRKAKDLSKVWARYLALLVCLCLPGLRLAAPGSSALAQDAQDHTIQQLHVQVMPEFDDPRVLVIVQGRLATPESGFPTSITFRLPREAQINQMATMDMNSGGATSQSFDTRPDPDDPRWQLVTYTLDNAHFFYEYYYDPIVGSVDKTFSFTLSSLQSVDNLLLEVQQPAAATHFSLSPSPDTTRLDEMFNLSYHQITSRGLPAGGELAISASYTKTDPAPSHAGEQITAVGSDAQPPDMLAVMPPQGEGRGSVDSTAPIEMAILLGGVVLIALIAFAWNRLQPAEAVRTPTQESECGPFCHRCGTVLKRNACFCHHCGVPARADFEKTCV